MRGLSNPDHPASTLVAGHFQEPGTAIRGLADQDLRSHSDDSPVLRRRPKVMQRRLGPDEIVELTEAYRAGTPVRDIAAQFGIGRGTVSSTTRDFMERWAAGSSTWDEGRDAGEVQVEGSDAAWRRMLAATGYLRTYSSGTKKPLPQNR